MVVSETSSLAPDAMSGAAEDSERPVVIEFRDVTKRFGTFEAISGLNLKIHESEFFSLLGPSGCGKTTLLRMIAGFERPSSGQVLLDGVDIAGEPPHKRPINMMFQSYALFPHLNVEKNIGFGLKQSGMAAQDMEDRVQEMLALVQLEPFAKRKPHQLSGGQRARVALARALAKKPRVLLLDEPLSALDRKLRETMQLELTDLQKKLGTTFVIVTHDKEEAMTISSRIAVMREGKIAQVAKPLEIYEQPNNHYIAEFIGDVNTFAAEIEEPAVAGMQEVLIDYGEGKLRLSGPEAEQMSESTCLLAIRPEKMEVEPTDDQAVEGLGLSDGKPTNFLIGKVEEIVYYGDLSTYHVRLDNGQIVRASMINGGRKFTRFERDQSVLLSWYVEDGMILRNET